MRSGLTWARVAITHLGKNFPHPVPQFPQVQPQGTGYKKAPDVPGGTNVTAMPKWELKAFGRGKVAAAMVLLVSLG